MGAKVPCAVNPTDSASLGLKVTSKRPNVVKQEKKALNSTLELPDALDKVAREPSEIKSVEPPHELLLTSDVSSSVLELYVRMSKFRYVCLSKGGELRVSILWGNDIEHRLRSSVSGEWSESFSFIWETTDTSLSSEIVSVRLSRRSRSSGEWEPAGGVDISLRDIARGPAHLDYQLRGGRGGRIKFDCQVDEVSKLFIAPILAGYSPLDESVFHVDPENIDEQPVSETRNSFELHGFSDEQVVPSASDPARVEKLPVFEWLLEFNLSGIVKTSNWSSQCGEPLWESLISCEPEISTTSQRPLRRVSSSVEKLLESPAPRDRPFAERVDSIFQQLDKSKASLTASLDDQILPFISLRTTNGNLDKHHVKIAVHRRHRVGQGVLDTIDSKLGESIVNLSRIKGKPTTSAKSGEYNVIFVKEAVIDDSKEIGFVQILFLISNLPKIRQSTLGVRTETGVLRESPDIQNRDQGVVSSVPIEISKLNSIHTKIEDLLFAPSDTGLLYSPKLANKSPYGSESEKNSIFSEINNLLQRPPFHFPNEMAEVQSKRTLANLIDFFVENLEICSYEDSRAYYTSLVYLLKRPEVGGNKPFSASLLSAFEALKRKDKKMPLNDIIKRSAEELKSKFNDLKPLTGALKKEKTSWLPFNLKFKGKSYSQGLTTEEGRAVVLYHEAMRTARVLTLSVHRLSHVIVARLNSGLEPPNEHRKVLSVLLGLLVFKLPTFRDEVLSCILNPQEKASGDVYPDGISIAKNFQWQTESTYEKKTLDWAPFHADVARYWGEKDLDKTITSLPLYNELLKPGWRSLFAHRGGLFQSFVVGWIKQIRACLKESNIVWSGIPGYLWLVKAASLDLKNRGAHAPDSLVAACGALIATDASLVSNFQKILMSSTAVYNQSAVYHSFVFLDYWFGIVIEYNRQLPKDYEYDFLKLALDRALSCDLVLCQAQALWFLYRNFTHLDAKLKDSLLNELFLNESMGPSFLLHWNVLVRRGFVYLVLFQLLQQPDGNLWNRQDVLNRIWSMCGQSIGKEAIAGLIGISFPQVQSLSSVKWIMPRNQAAYSTLAKENLKEAINVFHSWNGGHELPPLHVPLLLVQENQSEPSDA